MKRLSLALLTLLASTIAGNSGPVADFENALYAAYADYRVALFMTNNGKTEESSKAMSEMISKWSKIEADWGESPPPQYADDPKWHDTLSAVAETAEKAAAEVGANKLPEAHATLEKIREEIGELHQRNGIQSFSDRLNAYHSVMEKILETDLSKLDDANFMHINEEAAVLAFLADEALDNAPQETASSAEFGPLAKAMAGSANELLSAARARDAEKLKTAIARLKPAYAKLFLKFG